jgi:hypothetical protein
MSRGRAAVSRATGGATKETTARGTGRAIAGSTTGRGGQLLLIKRNLAGAEEEQEQG